MLFPSMLRTSGDWFADFEQLYDRMDELLGGRSGTSSIRAVGRAGAFPALNVGSSPMRSRSTPSRPASTRSRSTSRSRRGCSRSPANGRRRTSKRGVGQGVGRAHRLRQRALHRSLPPRRRLVRRRRSGPRRSHLPQRRAEDRRAEARIVEAAPDPDLERQLMPGGRFLQQRSHTMQPQSNSTAMQTQQPQNVQNASCAGPRRRCCRRSTSSRTPAASRCWPTCPASGARTSRSASTAAT